MSSKPKQQNNLDFESLQLDNGQQPMAQQNIVDNIVGISSRSKSKIDYSAKLNEYQNERDYENPMKQKQPIQNVNDLMVKIQMRI